MKLTPFLTFTFILAAVPAMAQRGMPSENRDTIHQLLAAHGKIKREVIVTYDGYTSSTKSSDKDVVAALQRHVNQMEARMKKGLMVRRWDPAYVEFIEHYDDINLKTQKTDDGVRVVAKRSTEAAKKVARNHAGIISKLVLNGMDEAHKAHAAVLGAATEAEAIEKKCCQNMAETEQARCKDAAKGSEKEKTAASAKGDRACCKQAEDKGK